ncbi:MAG: PEP-CTERM sorting domain-containing protein [Burkholderiales bacterium]|nr:PEP-CTERM sorting domain-containing protein [Burkholderiales bacterium]
MMISHLSGAENGIGNAIAPLGTLMGVFLDDRRPDSFRAPGALDFSGAGALDFKRLSPRLKQVFFIGDGLAAGTLQRFYVPNGATRLFLGTMDGYEWNNNSGAFNLKVKVNYLSEQMANTSAVPEPETYALMLTGLAMTGFAATRRRQ